MSLSWKYNCLCSKYCELPKSNNNNISVNNIDSVPELPLIDNTIIHIQGIKSVSYTHLTLPTKRIV